MLIPKIFPGDSVLGALRMRVWQNDEHAFTPEPGHIAIARNGLSHDEGNIELLRTKPRQIFARRAIDDTDFNLGMPRLQDRDPTAGR